MKHPSNNHEESELPPGWDPIADRDDSWQAIAKLLAEADKPAVPPPAVFQAMKMDIRKQLKAEGILRQVKDTDGSLGFGAWLKLLILGGGPGAQVVRFGAVAAVAFVAGTSLMEQPATPPVYTPSDVAVGGATPSTTDGQVAMIPAPTPTPAAVPSSVPVPKSFADMQGGDFWQSTVSQQQLPFILQNRGDLIPVSGTSSRVASSMTTPTASSYSSRINDSATDAFDQIQGLKMVVIADRNDRMQAELRRLDYTVRQMMEGNDTSANARLRAGDLYTAAEQSLAAQRYGEAQQLLEEAAALLPGTSLAALSIFQIGRTAYENQSDFEVALSAFERLQQQAGDRYLTEAQRTQLQERLAHLRDTASENWTGLRYYAAAERAANPVDAANSLLRAINETQSQRLAADAAIRLADLIITDGLRQEMDPAVAVEVLHQRVFRSMPSADTARIQYAAAEIVLRRQSNLRDAAVEYRTVLDLNPDDRIARLALMRLGALDAARSK